MLSLYFCLNKRVELLQPVQQQRNKLHVCRHVTYTAASAAFCIKLATSAGLSYFWGLQFMPTVTACRDARASRKISNTETRSFRVFRLARPRSRPPSDIKVSDIPGGAGVGAGGWEGRRGKKVAKHILIHRLFRSRVRLHAVFARLNTILKIRVCPRD